MVEQSRVGKSGHEEWDDLSRIVGSGNYTERHLRRAIEIARDRIQFLDNGLFDDNSQTIRAYQQTILGLQERLANLELSPFARLKRTIKRKLGQLGEGELG